MSQPPRTKRGAGERRARARLPISIRYGLPLAILGWFGWTAVEAWIGVRMPFRFVDREGAPFAVSGAVLEFLEVDDSPAGPSPTPELGRLELGPTPTTDAHVPSAIEADRVIARVRGIGLGTSFAVLERGRVTPIEVGPPLAISATVLGPVGVPIADARVQLFGGGRRGVLLAEATTGTDGTLTVDVVADSVRSVTFRVFADGYALTDHEWSVRESAPSIELLPAGRVSGRLVRSDGQPVGEQRLRLHHLPGATAVSDADGAFEFGNVAAPNLQAYVLVPSLTAEWTHRRIPLRAGERDVEVLIEPSQTVRGRVLNGHTGAGLAGANVSHLNGPNGVEAVLTDAEGRFEISRLPPGPVQILADKLVPRPKTPAGLGGRSESPTRRVLVQTSVRLTLIPGQAREDVVLTVY